MLPLNYRLPNKNHSARHGEHLFELLVKRVHESFLPNNTDYIVAVDLDCTPETEDKALLQMTPTLWTH